MPRYSSWPPAPPRSFLSLPLALDKYWEAGKSGFHWGENETTQPVPLHPPSSHASQGPWRVPPCWPLTQLRPHSGQSKTPNQMQTEATTENSVSRPGAENKTEFKYRGMPARRTAPPSSQYLSRLWSLPLDLLHLSQLPPGLSPLEGQGRAERRLDPRLATRLSSSKVVQSRLSSQKRRQYNLAL